MDPYAKLGMNACMYRTRRWGKPEEERSGMDPSLDWKTRYANADADDCHKASLFGSPDDDDGLRNVFVDLQRAKRAACLPRSAMEDMEEVPQCEFQRKLAEWRYCSSFRRKYSDR